MGRISAQKNPARMDALARVAFAWSAFLSMAPAGLAFGQQTFVPEAVAPASAVVETERAGYLTPDERRAFRVRHGIFDDTDLDTPARRAMVALERLDASDAAWADPSVAADLRLALACFHGNFAEIVSSTNENSPLPERAWRAQALAMLGRRDEALAIAVAAAPALTEATTVADLLAAVELGALRIRLDAASASTYRNLLSALARGRQAIDRLDPAIRVREAELLSERHVKDAAITAIGETLGLSPRASRAWRLAGELALEQFDFEGAARAIAALRRIAPTHPYAAFLEARSALMQDDPEKARAALAPVLALEPLPPEALAWKAACDAARYDFDAMRRTLAEFDRRAPGSALALVTAGKQLVFDRQYEEARATLEAAAAREPAWALPRAELGLLSMQDGRETRAVEDLRMAVALDPNDERTTFTLALAEELAGWERIETKHFVIRHPKATTNEKEAGAQKSDSKLGANANADAALVARLLAGVLDTMHDEVCARLGHEPAQKTLIDVMPDHRSFGVRITGLPRIHTIAVCTGPTIAIEIPKEGPQKKHLGLFDPLAVLRHEYTHTVTLSMTKNRIPHWLTEAVAVTLEETPRTFDTCQLLASATNRGTLFDLDGINWAFVRPEKPTDRPQAYAQGRWMVEYMEKRFGWDAIRKLLFSYADGIREDEAMRGAFGISREEFHREFLVWAASEVHAWGLSPEPSMRTLALELASADEAQRAAVAAAETARLTKVATAWSEAIGRPGSKRFNLKSGDWPSAPMPAVTFDDATIARLREAYPDQPDLVEIALRRARDGNDEAVTRALLERYAALRPVDPLPHRVWAKLAGTETLVDRGDDAAFGHLRELDLRADKDNVYALAMARNCRAAGELAAASEAAERAVRMNPFDATVRELAAAIAVEAGRLDRAEVHIEGLVALEPDRDIHRKRLARIRELLGGSVPRNAGSSAVEPSKAGNGG
jgi:tetratricopeptide (TPR) repeat protein